MIENLRIDYDEWSDMMKDPKKTKCQEINNVARKIQDMILWILDNQWGLKGISLLWKIIHIIIS